MVVSGVVKSVVMMVDGGLISLTTLPRWVVWDVGVVISWVETITPSLACSSSTVVWLPSASGFTTM